MVPEREAIAAAYSPVGADPVVGDLAGHEPGDQGWTGHVEHRSGLAGGELLTALGYVSRVFGDDASQRGVDRRGCLHR